MAAPNGAIANFRQRIAAPTPFGPVAAGTVGLAGVFAIAAGGMLVHEHQQLVMLNDTKTEDKDLPKDLQGTIAPAAAEALLTGGQKVRTVQASGANMAVGVISILLGLGAIFFAVQGMRAAKQ